MIALLLLICWPIAELFVAIKVAEWIGVLDTVLLLIVSWPLGAWAMRSQGRAAWRRLNDAIAAGRAPGREALDGALALIGGAFLIVPGFITDILGIALLLGPMRALMRRLAVMALGSRVAVSAARFTRRGARYDVDSTATEIEPPRLGR